MKRISLLVFLIAICTVFWCCSPTVAPNKAPGYTLWDMPILQENNGRTTLNEPEQSSIADSAKQEKFIYGKLLSLQKMNRQYFSSDWDGIPDPIPLPENERLAMRQYLYKNRSKPLYVAAQIQVLQVYDETAHQWAQAPSDSIYDFYYVERQGLFVSEEHQCLVHLEETFVPNSSARIFRLKPYAFLDNNLVIDSYTNPISEFEFANNEPKSLQYAPYQNKYFIKRLFEAPIRSGIIRALSEGNFDSLRTYMTMAREQEDFYGYMPLSDEEHLRIAALDIDSYADSSLWNKMNKMWNHVEQGQWVKDSLQDLIKERSYPLVFSDSFYNKARKYSNGPYLVNFAQRPFIDSSTLIPDNRVSLRIFAGPTMRFYNDEMQQFLGSKSIGGTGYADLCYLYGCFGFGLSIYATSGGTDFIKEDNTVYRRKSTSTDASAFFHFGVRPIFNEILDVEIYGLLNATIYGLDEKNDKGKDMSAGSGDWGIGASISSNLFVIKGKPNPHNITTIDYRFNVEYLWNSKPEKLLGPQGHTLAVSLQLGIGTTSYRFKEESKDQPSRTIKEELAHFWKYP